MVLTCLLVAAFLAHPYILGLGVPARVARVGAERGDLSADRALRTSIPRFRNAAVLYARAFRHISSSAFDKDYPVLIAFLDPDARRANPDLLRGAREAIVRYDSTLDLVRQASRKPECEWHPNDCPASSRIVGMRQLRLLLAAQAILAAEDGLSGVAVESVIALFQLGESLSSDTSSSAQFTRLAMHRSSARVLRQVLARGTPDRAHSAALLEAIRSIDVADSVSVALRHEREQGINVFEQARRAGADPSSAATTPKTLGPLRVISDAILNADEAYYLSAMEERIAAAKLPHGDPVVRRLDAELGTCCPDYAPMSGSMVPALEGALRARDRTAGDLQSSRRAVSAAVRRWSYLSADCR